MKASKFADAQKAFVIKQGEEGTPVAEVCRKAGIREATYFNWKKCAGLLPTAMRRLRAEGGEWPPQEDRGPPDARPGDNAGYCPPEPPAEPRSTKMEGFIINYLVSKIRVPAR